MEKLLREFKPNANRKYYEFMSLYIEKMIHESEIELSTIVDKLIENRPISKPTFYSYFHNSEDFYEELLELIAYTLPSYMAKKAGN